MEGQRPTLQDVIRRAIATAVADLHVSIPARVERYDAAQQLVDVTPLLKDVVEVAGERRALSIPVITSVPVAFPGAGGFRLTFPVERGDTCLLVFSDRSLDVWLAQGGEVDPADPRRHALSDAVAWFGLHDLAHPWTGARADAATLGRDGGPQIICKETEINLGGDSGLEGVGLGDAVKAHLDELRAWLQSHTHPGVQAGSGVSAPPGAPPPTVPETASGTVKVKP